MKNTKVRIGSIGFVNLAALFFLVGNVAHAYQTPPACLDNQGHVLPVMNAQVIQWKTSTPNETLARALVAGPIVRIYPNQTGHAHFAIQLGNAPQDTLEVVYNLDFGKTEPVAIGMMVEACGDFINSFKPGNGYQASPDGAIIHWVHLSNSRNHQSGFLEINGILYGEDASSGG